MADHNQRERVNLKIAKISLAGTAIRRASS